MALTNSQYEELDRELSAKRLRNEQDQYERQNMAYKTLPRLKEISDERAHLSVSYAKSRILGAKQSEAEYLTEMAALTAEEAQILKTAGLPEDYLQLHYDCPICKDTGVVDHKRCKCYTRSATALLYKQSGISEILKVENFDNFDLSLFPEDHYKTFGSVEVSSRDNMSDILKTCKTYVRNFADAKGNLLFTGATGCGKTYMTHCIAGALMDEGFSVVYMSAEAFFENAANKQFHYDEDEEYSEHTPFFYETDLLIIDDLSSEYINNLTTAKLFSCINERINRGAGTIISTNKSLSELRDTYSDRVYSRLIGSYQILPFFAPDIRRIPRRKHN